MKTATKILVIITLCFSFAGMAKADSAPPTKQTTFYFQKDGQPVTQPINFTIKCYGTSAMSGDNKLLKISETSETCQSYGCKFDTSNVFEVYRQNTKYCDLSGEINGENFTVNKFLGDNLSELSCHRADFTISTGDKYYKETPKYNSCRSDVYREYYPQGNGDVKGDFLCAQYETDEKLIPTTISTEPNGPCYRYGYTIKNNICYQIPQAFFDCTAGEDRKMKICDQYLEDVTTKLAKNKNGYPFEEICEAKVNVPVSISNANNQQTPSVQLTTPAEQPHSKNIFSRIIDFFRCSFLKIFGKSC